MSSYFNNIEPFQGKFFNKIILFFKSHIYVFIDKCTLGILTLCYIKSKLAVFNSLLIILIYIVYVTSLIVNYRYHEETLDFFKVIPFTLIASWVSIMSIPSHGYFPLNGFFGIKTLYNFLFLIYSILKIS